MVDLSVEQILECDAVVDVEQRKADCGFFGGWPYLAMQYVIEAGGLASEADYPYCVAMEGMCLIFRREEVLAVLGGRV